MLFRVKRKINILSQSAILKLKPPHLAHFLNQRVFTSWNHFRGYGRDRRWGIRKGLLGELWAIWFLVAYNFIRFLFLWCFNVVTNIIMIMPYMKACSYCTKIKIHSLFFFYKVSVDYINWSIQDKRSSRIMLLHPGQNTSAELCGTWRITLKVYWFFKLQKHYKFFAKKLSPQNRTKKE